MKKEWQPKHLCRHCKVETEGLTIDSRNKYGHYYFTCRKCNTERQKRYRATPTGIQRVRAAVYKSTKKFQYKQDARIAVRMALKKGELIKPEQCTCGNPKVEAHHEDYSKPLEVEWMCRKCHADLHALQKC